MKYRIQTGGVSTINVDSPKSRWEEFNLCEGGFLISLWSFDQGLGYPHSCAGVKVAQAAKVERIQFSQYKGLPGGSWDGVMPGRNQPGRGILPALTAAVKVWAYLWSHCTQWTQTARRETCSARSTPSKGHTHSQCQSRQLQLDQRPGVQGWPWRAWAHRMKWSGDNCDFYFGMWRRVRDLNSGLQLFKETLALLPFGVKVGFRCKIHLLRLTTMAQTKQRSQQQLSVYLTLEAMPPAAYLRHLSETCLLNTNWSHRGSPMF